MYRGMTDGRDIVDISGVRIGSSAANSSERPNPDGEVGSAGGVVRPFLGVWFRCCHAYGRMYKVPDGTRYAGQCPRCGAAVGAAVGEGGTSQRIFSTG